MLKHAEDWQPQTPGSIITVLPRHWLGLCGGSTNLCTITVLSHELKLLR